MEKQELMARTAAMKSVYKETGCKAGNAFGMRDAFDTGQTKAPREIDVSHRRIETLSEKSL